MSRKVRVALALVVTVFMLVAAGCSGNDNEPSSPASPAPAPAPAPETTEVPTDTTQFDISEIIERVLAESDPVPQTEASSAALASPDTGSSQIAAARTYSTAVLNHAFKIWNNWFKANTSAGLSNDWTVGWYFVEGADTFTSNCELNNAKIVVNGTYPNAFYCDADDRTGSDGTVYHGTIILPTATLLEMWNGKVLGKQAKLAGDFEAATIIAHEFGHKIQALLQPQLSLGKIATPKNNELIADCFSGVWAVAVWKDGLLEAGDVDEAVASLEAIGDDDYYSPTHHGTADERANAWKIGYYGSKANPAGGEPMNCVKAFWN